MVVIQMTWWYVWLDLELRLVDNRISSCTTEELSLLCCRRRPSVLRTLVQDVTIRGRWIGTIKRTHHVSSLHIEHNHGGRIRKRSELTHSIGYRQPLIRYRTPTVPSWFRVIVIQIE